MREEDSLQPPGLSFYPGKGTRLPLMLDLRAACKGSRLAHRSPDMPPPSSFHPGPPPSPNLPPPTPPPLSWLPSAFYGGVVLRGKQVAVVFFSLVGEGGKKTKEEKGL